MNEAKKHNILDSKDNSTKNVREKLVHDKQHHTTDKIKKAKISSPTKLSGTQNENPVQREEFSNQDHDNNSLDIVDIPIAVDEQVWSDYSESPNKVLP